MSARYHDKVVANAVIGTTESEAWAVGKRDGVDVVTSDPVYHNNSKYYAGLAEQHKSRAVTAETNAKASETSAAESLSNATAQATAAAGSAKTATDKASAAATSASNAAKSATASANSASASATSAQESETSATSSADSASASANSATAAAASQKAAKTSETNAKASETNAANSASSAGTSATNSANSASASAESAAAALASQNAAETSETNAASSASTASSKATAASKSASAAKTSETNAATSATNAATSATNAASSETAAANSATAAAASQKAAKTSETNAKASETAAKTSETNAKASETAAKDSETNAASSASTASSKAAAASNSATAAANSASSAQTSADAAAAALEECRNVTVSVTGALVPKGTIAFASLPALSAAEIGWMYNISNAFTTTADFEEGSGKAVNAGSNVYKTANGKWDVLAGATVTGVKGDAETKYRTGNVNITPANIGLDKVDNTPDAEKSVASSGVADCLSGTEAVGSSVGPVYMKKTDKGLVPAACRKATAGDYKSFIPVINEKGCVRVGKFIYMNEIESTEDYDIRLVASPGALTCSGTFTATKVYNATWNDYADALLKKEGEVIEPGDIVCMSRDEDGYECATKKTAELVVGVCSDTYGHLLGGEQLENMEDNLKKYTPVAVAGNVYVKVSGKIQAGDFITVSRVPGVGKKARRWFQKPGTIVGKALQSKHTNGVERILMQVMLK